VTGHGCSSSSSSSSSSSLLACLQDWNTAMQAHCRRSGPHKQHA
jgi:hypothetical protein